MIGTIRRAIEERGGLAIAAETLSPEADLYRAGLTPFAAVEVMLALERELRIEFPKRMLNRESMVSMNAIRARISDLQGAKPQLKAA